MKRLWFAVQLLLSAVCLVIVVRMVRPTDVRAALDRAEPLFLAVVFLLMPPAVFTRAWRWWYILRSKGVGVSIWTIWRVTYIGMALNLVLPGGGGDVARSYYGWRSAGNKEAMLASALSDKVVALFTLCLLGAVCAIPLGSLPLFLVSMGFSVPFGIVLFVPKVVPWRAMSWLARRVLRRELSLEGLHFAFHMGPRLLGVCVLISLVGWAFTNLMYYYACVMLGCRVSVWYVFAIAPLVTLMRIVPITISGLGSADLLIVSLFKTIGVTESTSLMVSMAINIALIALPGLIGAGFMLLSHMQSRRQAAAPDLGPDTGLAVGRGDPHVH